MRPAFDSLGHGCAAGSIHAFGPVLLSRPPSQPLLEASTSLALARQWKCGNRSLDHCLPQFKPPDFMTSLESKYPKPQTSALSQQPKSLSSKKAPKAKKLAKVERKLTNLETQLLERFNSAMVKKKQQRSSTTRERPPRQMSLISGLGTTVTERVRSRIDLTSCSGKAVGDLLALLQITPSALSPRLAVLQSLYQEWKLDSITFSIDSLAVNCWGECLYGLITDPNSISAYPTSGGSDALISKLESMSPYIARGQWGKSSSNKVTPVSTRKWLQCKSSDDASDFSAGIATVAISSLPVSMYAVTTTIAQPIYLWLETTMQFRGPTDNTDITGGTLYGTFTSPLPGSPAVKRLGKKGEVLFDLNFILEMVGSVADAATLFLPQYSPYIKAVSTVLEVGIGLFMDIENSAGAGAVQYSLDYGGSDIEIMDPGMNWDGIITSGDNYLNAATSQLVAALSDDDESPSEYSPHLHLSTSVVFDNVYALSQSFFSVVGTLFTDAFVAGFTLPHTYKLFNKAGVCVLTLTHKQRLSLPRPCPPRDRAGFNAYKERYFAEVITKHHPEYVHVAGRFLRAKDKPSRRYPAPTKRVPLLVLEEQKEGFVEVKTPLRTRFVEDYKQAPGDSKTR